MTFDKTGQDQGMFFIATKKLLCVQFAQEGKERDENTRALEQGVRNWLLQHLIKEGRTKYSAANMRQGGRNSVQRFWRLRGLSIVRWDLCPERQTLKTVLKAFRRQIKLWIHNVYFS